jgi:peptidoglycan/LPS O-acetylase OafA/YrhL
MGHAASRRSLRFQLLDPLRGVAALWVFTFHYGFSTQSQTTFPWLMSIFRLGDLGVPMFFVISGYCLMASLRTALRHSETVGSFMYRRALRIYPPFWCSVAVVAALPFAIEALSWLKTGTFLRPTAVGNINLGFLSYSPSEWIKVLTLTQVFADVPQATNLQIKFTTLNAVYWTLAIEFQFYIVMAVALAMRGRALAWLIGVTALSLPIAYVGVWNAVGIFLPYWPMFAGGIALYLIIERGLSYAEVGHGRGTTAALVIALSVVGAFILWTLSGRQVSLLGFAVLFVVLLWFLHGVTESDSKNKRHGGMLTRAVLGTWSRLGLMSYSLYLLHGRLQFLAHQLCRQVLPAGIALDAATIVGTCLMCYGFYACCERPFIRSRVVATPAHPPADVATLGAATAV